MQLAESARLRWLKLVPKLFSMAKLRVVDGGTRQGQDHLECKVKHLHTNKETLLYSNLSYTYTNKEIY